MGEAGAAEQQMRRIFMVDRREQFDRGEIDRRPVAERPDQRIESSSLRQRAAGKVECARHAGNGSSCAPVADRRDAPIAVGAAKKSEEHTSELQSLMRISYAVFCFKNKQ